MAGYTFTPEALLSTTPKKLSDGSIQIGDTIIDPARVGEGFAGRGNAGEEKRAGSNIFKANAIEEILKRGPGKDGTYLSNGGLIGNLTGVTEQDIENAQTTKYTNDLKRKYGRDLKSLGLGDVEWGDTEVSVQNRIAETKKSKELKNTEPARIKLEKEKAKINAQATNRGLRAENEEGRRFAASETRADNAEKEGQRRYDLEVLRDERIRSENALTRSQERTQDLELRRDNMNLQYAQMARRDRMDAKDRKDKNIMMLMQGLAGIATGFTVQRLRIIPLSSSF